MKLIVYVALGVIGLFLVYTLLTSFMSRKIETPQYEVVREVDDAEIRRYPKMVVAKTYLADSSFDNNRSVGFRTIANYIFGGNDRGQQIAMTAPVVMDMSDTASMYFVMPSQYQAQELPRPNSGRVRIEEEAEKHLIVLRFGGFASDSRIRRKCERLSEIIQVNGIQTKGDFLFMGYNAPWDLINRRNEVAVEVVIP
jgi:SOUL heme-binding protein